MLPPWRYRSLGSYYVLYYYLDEETLGSFIARLYLRYKKGLDVSLPSPSPLFVATALVMPCTATNKNLKQSLLSLSERKVTKRFSCFCLMSILNSLISFL